MIELQITPADIRFAIGVHHEQVLTSITDPTIQSHIDRFETEVTTGISDDFANIQLIRSITVTFIKHYFWIRMNAKDVPDHIREEKKNADKLLSDIRKGLFRDSVVDPSFTSKERYFTNKL